MTGHGSSYSGNRKHRVAKKEENTEEKSTRKPASREPLSYEAAHDTQIADMGTDFSEATFDGQAAYLSGLLEMGSPGATEIASLVQGLQKTYGNYYVTQLFSDLRRDETDSLLASAAPPPTHVVLEEEKEAGGETAEGTLPGLGTEATPPQAGEMKESDEAGSTLESDVLPTAFIDGGSRGEDRVWWAGGTLESDVLPTAFVDGGSTGSDTVYWAGGGATGAQGNQGVGSFQEKVDPVYENAPASAGGKYMAWIRDDTGKVKVERSYVSVKTGANGNAWYITVRAKTRIETHEKGHVNKSKELYESHVKPVEDKVPGVRGKVNAVEAGTSAAKAVKSLKDAVKWDDGIKNFKQKDKDVNKPGGTWDTQEQATADWYYDYGPRTVGTKNYTHYVDQTPGPPSAS